MPVHPSSQRVVSYGQPRLARARRSRRGDTLIEIMAALVLASIGMVGIASLQGTTVRSNQDSQEINFAINFGRTWIQRIKRDSVAWQAPGNPNLGVVLAARTPNATYFVPNAGWGLPVPLDANESPGADSRGVDIGSPTFLPAVLPLIPVANLHYCVNTSFTTLQVNAANQVEKMNASVRVWWARRASQEATDHTDPALALRRTAGACTVPIPTELSSNNLRVLYLSTPLRYTTP